ncbi:MAG: D-lyxose/D-mannose family sugar isomerase [Promethearchaeota archaeon]
MKRSEIDSLILKSIDILHENKFFLPEFAYWTLNTWKKQNKEEIHEILDRKLGWDITDYGSGDFHRCGLIHFTLRNGKSNSGRNYCEKIMIGFPGQKLPWHYHFNKYEDIINRGGGNLIVQVYQKTKNNDFSIEKIPILIDGIKKVKNPGEKIILKPGQSIYLNAGIFHRFWADSSASVVLIGEVSSVNDDKSDNFYKGVVQRFMEIEEDENPIYLLYSDYEKYLFS